jgi:hypothetical protein
LYRFLHELIRHLPFDVEKTAARSSVTVVERSEPAAIRLSFRVAIGVSSVKRIEPAAIRFRHKVFLAKSHLSKASWHV